MLFIRLTTARTALPEAWYDKYLKDLYPDSRRTKVHSLYRVYYLGIRFLKVLKMSENQYVDKTRLKILASKAWAKISILQNIEYQIVLFSGS